MSDKITVLSVDSHPLWCLWLGMVTAMAIVIEYYVPDKFRKRNDKWIPSEQRGKIIPFPAPKKKSA